MFIVTGPITSQKSHSTVVDADRRQAGETENLIIFWAMITQNDHPGVRHVLENCFWKYIGS
jgi:hypothetical protein